MPNLAVPLTILLSIVVAIGLYSLFPTKNDPPGKYKENISSGDTSIMTASKQKFAQTLRQDCRVMITNDDIVSLGDFTFNSLGETKIAANISLKFTNYDKSWFSFNDGKNEILKRGAILRSSVIDTMMENHGTQTNNDELKKKLLLNINSKLCDAVATEVYFNKFIVQH